MKVKVLYFPHLSGYFHICESILRGSSGGFERWFRDGGRQGGYFSVHKTNAVTNQHSLVDEEMFNYLMDKFGTLEGTYAEWEL